MTNTLVYELDNKIYINLTNRCTSDCIFCLRNDKADVCGSSMWLKSEDFTAQDVINQLSTLNSSARPPRLSTEITFCGYGEPTLKLDILKEVASYIKQNYPDTKIRLNTNGHANFVHKRNIVPELAGLIDEISVSLNAPTPEQYDELSQPKFRNAYNEVLDFIKKSSEAGIKTTASVVDGYKGLNLDLEACRQQAAGHGAALRVREWIQNGY
ncbi:MAG: TatD family nuclease-associated radical SAM protein [Heliobacteriaceae bacterium]|jgi:TatD family-associated radical SAM protein|nr:TatD family nuclease-associated radical SAM protein [Heliobacteriaceae bacterium]